MWYSVGKGTAQDTALAGGNRGVLELKKIILLCASGMSTSMMVKKMQAAAATLQYSCEIAAYPMAEAKEKGADADLILLGPQVRFSKAKVEQQCPGVPVDAIDMRIYGRMDGEAVMKLAMDKLDN